MTALHACVGIPAHVVAQVVEAKLVVGAVGDVAGIGFHALAHFHARQNHAYAQAKVAVHAAHPLCVALGQIVVDRDDVHPVARERIEIRGRHAGQRLALTGLHLDDRAVVQDDAAHELDVEDALAELPTRCLACQRKRLRQDPGARLTGLEARSQLVGPRRKVGFRESDHPRLELVDPVHQRNQSLEVAVGL